MKVDTKKLLTVKSYAIKMGVTTTAVYKWISQGKEKSVRIDGVCFVILNDE